MPNIIKKYPVLSICILVAIMLLPNLDLWQVSIMEARNFITAREMVLDGNWLLTTMNGEARYQKPPLPTWLSAISALIFGVKSLFAMRLPAVFMVMIVGVYTYKLSNRILQNQTHSLINAFIIITSFYIVGIVFEAPWDIFTHGFMLIAIYQLFSIFEAHKLLWKELISASVFIGFSILSKGPISFYALLLPFLIAYGFSYTYKDIKKKIIPYITILLLALIIGGWWFLYVRIQDPETFNAIATKETNNWSSYNVRPFYYYWSFFTQSGLWTIPAFISLLYPYIKSRVKNKKAYRFSFLWTLLVVVLLSIIPEKKSRYLMPVLIPLAINCGFYINYLFKSFKTLKDKKETLPVSFNFGIIALTGISVPILLYILLNDNLTNYWLQYLIASTVLFALGIWIFIQLIKKNFNQVFKLTVTFYIAVFVVGLPVTKALVSDSYSPVNKLFQQATEKELTIYSYHSLSPEVIWQLGDKVVTLKPNETPKEDRFWVLNGTLDKLDVESLQKKFEIKKIKQYDLNRGSKNSGQYNKRLTTELYLFKKL